MNAPLGVIFDMSFEDYHAVDALSATGLRLLARSPWHYRNRVAVDRTRPMLCGSLAHCAVLEPDAMGARYIVIPEGAPRRPSRLQWAARSPSQESKDAMAWWTAFNESAAGRDIITADEYAITQMQLAAIARDPDISATLQQGCAELSVFWIDPQTGVYCKARPDWMHEDEEVELLDLKSTADESPNGFGRAAARMKYHLQRAHYTEGVEIATGKRVSRFTFVAVTNTAPVLAVPYFLTEELDQQAKDERRELIERFAWCKREDEWPAYGSGPQLLDFPAYAKRSNELEVSFVD